MFYMIYLYVNNTTFDLDLYIIFCMKCFQANAIWQTNMFY